MQWFCKRNFSQSAATWLLTLLLALGVILPAQAAPDNPAFALPAAASTDAATPSHAFTFDQIGAEVDKQSGQASTIVATDNGATVRAPFQALVGALTSTGLWLRSTAADTQAATSPTRSDRPFRVQASAIGRGPGTARRLALTGTVTVANGLARWRRPGVVEEYSASTDGVRQDFLLLERPAGQGALRLELTVAGATLHRAADGVRLQLNATGRTLAYHRLQVSDAQGQQLPAHMQVLTPTRLAIVVDEAGAATPVTWPLRIDPTFSDANWLPLGDGIDNVVRALAVIGSDLYVGGNFSTAGGVSASNIAKWDGSSWSALGDGLNNVVRALAVIGSDLYVGGNFSTAGGVSAIRIAKWDGSSWSALGTGLDNQVNALAVSGSDLYAGGFFSTAGGVSANAIAKWDGTTWSALGSGLDNRAYTLAVSGSNLYVGGFFSTAGGVSANSIAKWDGSSWSALGDGLDSNVFALAVSGSDLYVGGDFTTAGGVSASAIAKWDGSTWSALGDGLDSAVLALAVSGSDLYVAGFFTTAGGGSANRIAKWDGSTWSAFGSGLNSAVIALALSGSDFYVGGAFTTAGVSTANGIAKAQLLSAQLAVTGQGVSIPSGATTPSSSDDTDFGNVTLGGSPVVHTFTLHNNGSAALTVSAIDSSGGDASDFVSSGLTLPATIAAGSSATFNVTFTPGAAGLRTTTLTIASDDPNTPSYTFALQGTGSTPVPPAQITIVLDTQPDRPTNLGFNGSLGAFLLDDPASDDGDAYSNRQTFSVAPGTYTVRRNAAAGWFLTDITCTPSGQASLNLFQRRATITVASGDSVTCTYTVQQAAHILARAFNDLVRNSSNLGKRNAGDPWLNGWAMRVYSAPNALVANDWTGPTTVAGLYQANFTTLQPGSYTICTTLPDNTWTPTAPSATDPNYANQPCKPVTLLPGQAATVLFGAYQPTVVASAAFTPADEVVTDADTIVDQPYDPADDETATAEESRPRLFLPLIVR